MNKSSNLFLGGIFVAGMATTYLLRQMKVLSAETRVFEATCDSDGYETNAPAGYTGVIGIITKRPQQIAHPFKVTRSDNTSQVYNFATLAQAKAHSGFHGVGAWGKWSDRTVAANTANCCPTCADCDSCCPACPACPPVVKCDSCCPTQTTKGGRPPTISGSKTRKWWRW